MLVDGSVSRINPDITIKNKVVDRAEEVATVSDSREAVLIQKAFLLSIYISANMTGSERLWKYTRGESMATLAEAGERSGLNSHALAQALTHSQETGEPLAPSAEHSPDGKFRGFIGWNLLVQNMLEGVVSGKWTLLNL